VATLLPDTAVVGKAADLAAHRSGALRVHELVPEDLAVVVAGTTGVTRLLGRISGVQDGATFAGRVLWTRTWHLEEELGWRVLGAHISPL
jgi:hypothetical protein